MLRACCFRRLLALFLFLIPATLAAVAQQAPATAAAAELKDGVYRRNGQMFRLQNGQSSVLTQALGLGNGYTVQPSGVLLGPNGSRRQLTDGQAINQQGQVVILRDDMFTASAIEEHDRRTTGAQPTVIEAPAGQALAPELLAQLQRTEARLQHLQQLTALLAQRTARPTGSEAAALDKRIQQLSQQVRAR